jgi:outer membrane protein assembly factor BamD (BamD/ComL family)
MFFKHIVIGFMIIGVLGYMFGDHVFYFQANLMVRWQYPLPAYEAYERIIRYYPQSQFIGEAKIMMKALRERSRDLNRYIEQKETELKKIQDDRQKKQSFH